MIRQMAEQSGHDPDTTEDEDDNEWGRVALPVDPGDASGSGRARVLHSSANNLSP